MLQESSAAGRRRGQGQRTDADRDKRQAGSEGQAQEQEEWNAKWEKQFRSSSNPSSTLRNMKFLIPAPIQVNEALTDQP